MMVKPPVVATKTQVLCGLLLCGMLSISACSTYTRYSRWATHRGAFNDARFLPSAIVANNDSTFTDLENSKGSAILATLGSFSVKGVTLEDYLFERDTNSLVVLHRGTVVLERYANGFGQDSVQPTYSVTKSIVSLLLDIALRDGLIDSFDDPLSNYLPELGSGLGAVTIRHCMNMVSGLALNNSEIAGIPVPWNDEVKEYYDPDLRGLVTQMSIVDKPNTRFTYQSYNQVLLGLVLEKVSGNDLATYASKKLWRPLGMEFEARWTIDSEQQGFAKPGSGFNATAIDLARLGQAMLTRPDAIPDESANHATQPCCVQPVWSLPADEAVQAPEFADHVRAVRYSNGWWGVETSDRYDFYANGHLGQFIYLSPDAELVIVRLGSSHGGADDAEFSFQFYRFASAVIDAQSP